MNGTGPDADFLGVLLVRRGFRGNNSCGARSGPLPTSRKRPDGGVGCTIVGVRKGEAGILTEAASARIGLPPRAPFWPGSLSTLLGTTQRLPRGSWTSSSPTPLGVAIRSVSWVIRRTASSSVIAGAQLGVTRALGTRRRNTSATRSSLSLTASAVRLAHATVLLEVRLFCLRFVRTTRTRRATARRYQCRGPQNARVPRPDFPRV